MMDRRAGLPRAEFTAQVSLTRLGSYEKFEARTVNVSMGGMLLRSTEPLNVGDVLRFDAPRFAGGCKVMWVSNYPGNILVGVHFTVLGPEAKKRLAEIAGEPQEAVPGTV